MFNLLFKDLRIQFFGDSDFKKKLIKLIILIFLMGSLAIFIAFIFSKVIEKVNVYEGAANAYLTLFLSIVSLLMIIMNLIRAYKLFFDKKDIEILTKYPVTNGQIIGSKMIYILLAHYVTSIVFIYPIFISYAMTQGRSALFYFITIFYPLLSFLFEGGIALLLVYPFKLIIDGLIIEIKKAIPKDSLYLSLNESLFAGFHKFAIPDITFGIDNLNKINSVFPIGNIKRFKFRNKVG